MEDRDRFVDELLDSALAHHRDAEPRAGLEGRILAHVRAAASERDTGRKVWKLWVAAAATAAVVVFVAIHVARPPHSPSIQTPQAGNTVSAPAPKETLTAISGAVPKTAPSPRLVEPKRTAQRESKPPRRVETHQWPSQFPTPAPLSDEQKALVQYVRQTPPQVLATPILKADFTVQRVKIKPLDIPSLEIRPFALGPVEEEVQ
jgi:hypothetical protein